MGLLEQIRAGEQQVTTALDTSDFGLGGNRKTPPGRWKAKIVDACVHPNKDETDLVMSIEVEIQEGPAMGATIKERGPFPAVATTDENYSNRAFKIRQVLGSVLSFNGGKAKLEEYKEKGAVNLSLQFRGTEPNKGQTYTLTQLVGKDCYVRTNLEASATDPNREYSRIAKYISKEEYDMAPGQEQDVSFTQPGNTANAGPEPKINTANAAVNETVNTNVNLANAPSNGTSPAAQAAEVSDLF